jgi:thioester reductase-like protein
MNVFLTGSTGFVGGELLVSLSKRTDIKKIFCFIRAESDAEAALRLEKVFDLRDDFFDRNKIIPISGNLFDINLAESLRENKILKEVDVIIHSAANTSFSRIYDSMVEQVNISGLEKLLQWAVQLPHLHTFLYIGTATICGKDIINRVIREEESPDISARHLVRYTYTKMQGELLLNKYLPREKILIARPSIIMGDSRPVMPRSPVILWTVATINMLRFIPVNEHAALDMIPVDYAAHSIIELLFAKRRHNTYHISAGLNGGTSTYKLSKSLEPHFDDLPPFHFVDKSMLPQVKQWARNRLKQERKLTLYKNYIAPCCNLCLRMNIFKAACLS